MPAGSEQVVELAIVTAIAVATVYLLLRTGRRTRRAAGRADLALGYPVDHFPAHALTRSGPLAALASAQARLMAMYAQLPADSSLGLWLLAFLKELRDIMNTAYRVVAINAAYGPPPQLERLVGEVERTEREIAAHVTAHLLGSGGGENGFLDEQVAMLRFCAQELANLSGTPASMPAGGQTARPGSQPER